MSSVYYDVIKDDLQLYYESRVVESYNGVGTTIYDISGNSRHGTLVNGITYDLPTKSLVYDGTNDYVQTPYVYSLGASASADFTVTRLFNTTTRSVSTGSSRLLVSNFQGTPIPFNIYIDISTGKAAGNSRGSSGSVTITSTTVIDNGVDHTVTYRKVGNVYSLFVDGVLEATTTVNIGSCIVTNNMTLGVLANLLNQGFYKGNDYVTLIYSVGLTNAQILANHNALFNLIIPVPPTETFLQKQILKTTNQLYPTGRAFNLLEGTTFNNLHKALAKSESQAFEDAKGILNHILPDNDNFGTDDAALWENRLGLITNTAVSLADRKLAIQRKMNQPGEYPARQSWDYLEQQLQAAGFSVYVHENIPEISIYDFLITNNIYQLGVNQLGEYELGALAPDYSGLFDIVQLGDSQLGDFELSESVYTNKAINHIEEQKDTYFPVRGNFRSTFFVGGITKGDFANVPLARKEEFRQLILKIKPAQTIGYLLINYV